MIRRLYRAIVGAPKDPLSRDTRQHMALAAFLAWVGLGADGLSSANYGPEEAFLALGHHTHLALYIALMTALTVFVISLAYNQVIRLFPSGGGGYKVASTLLGPHAGLVSGSALMVDYVLTIAISVASGVDALFSLLPVTWQGAKLGVEIATILGLMVLNLRGMKEPLRLLVPIFLGFVGTHLLLILGGILAHAEQLPGLLPATFSETSSLTGEIGWVAVASLLLRAYSLGAGTYTGIEAVSNNVHILREPRVRTGQWTMALMATSLAVTAAGLISLYLLWNVGHVPGETLNATTFKAILGETFGDGSLAQSVALLIVMVLAAGLLFVAANTGFLGGPSVLANMAADRWAPHAFAYLSVRLVTQNGIFLMGIAALTLLVITGGKVSLLVVLYSINVFLTFTLCLAGLVRHWWRQLGTRDASIGSLLQAGLALIVAGSILVVTLFEKFFEGGWLTVIITSLVIVLGLAIRRHYDQTAVEIAKIDALFATTTRSAPVESVPAVDPALPTAIFMVGRSFGAGMHTLLAVRRMFPGHFRNFVFISVGEVDSESFRGSEQLARMTADVEASLGEFERYCQRRGLPAASKAAYGTDAAHELARLAEKLMETYPHAVFFASKLIFGRDSLFSRLLHNHTALAVQRRLHLKGIPMVILPMKV
ncbi:APC family permease [Zavarzinia sp.]|uniref:APC family permease n=1 Tax=Zavarzinia sp. TaxID=2027920 RepID=UPI003BB6E2EA